MQIELNSLNYQSPISLPETSTRLHSYFADCFQRIKERRPLSNVSLREYLGINHALDPISIENAGPICSVINYLWVSFNHPEALRTYPLEMREELILPALFSRSLIIRRPNAEDSDRIFKKLYIFFPEFFVPVVLGNGVNGSERGMVLQASNETNTKSKTYGAIHYIFKETVCQIFSLVIHEKKWGLKYGSLLLNAAIIDAKKANLSVLELNSNRLGVPLYLSVGFIPSMVFEDSNKQEWWKTLSLPVKIKIAQEMHDRKMTIDLENTLTAKQSLKKALNFFDQVPQIPATLTVEIPQEAYDFGLICNFVYDFKLPFMQLTPNLEHAEDSSLENMEEEL